MRTPVSDRSEVVERLREAEDHIRSLGVRRLALFGSFARATNDADSDVDLLVEFERGKKSFDRFTALADLVEDSLGRRVDLITTEGLSPFIGPTIQAEAEDVVRAAVHPTPFPCGTFD